MLRKVFGLASLPVRTYWTDFPFEPESIEEHHEYEPPHADEATVKAWGELQAVLDTLPKRSYVTVLDELINRSKRT